MNHDTIIAGLTALQADGLACVACGADYLRVRVPHVPAAGRGTVHRCSPALAAARTT